MNEGVKFLGVNFLESWRCEILGVKFLNLTLELTLRLTLELTLELTLGIDQSEDVISWGD